MTNKFDQAAYTAAYNKQNYARVCIMIPPEEKAEWQMEAKSQNISLTELIRQRMKGDKMKTYYSIIDDDGNVFAHDIKDRQTAEVLLENYKKYYISRGEQVPEGIEIISDDE